MMPAPLIVDVIAELMSSLIAFSVGYYALRGYRVARERVLLQLNLSFTLVGSGMLVHVASKLSVILPALRSPRPPPPVKFVPVVRVGYLIYFAAGMVGYSILLYAYLKKARGFSSLLLLLPREYDPAYELLLLFILSAVTAFSVQNYLTRRSLNSLMVSAGFMLIAISHLLLVMTRAGPIMLMLAGVVRLAGFSSFLAMVVRVERLAGQRKAQE
ncbi:MAG: hypothetical protein DRN96_03960 [Thermoproteota archaeon]|nr:MAG: hypothetical protein DRN96_03960 [Candidatus Korarchaeota archaeon]RLG55263.1 MAG: hypothetical protein DRN99_03175 [Candidatus Korarchaeota archaeon]